MEASKPVCPWCGSGLAALNPADALSHAIACRQRSLLSVEQPPGVFTFARELLRALDANP